MVNGPLGIQTLSGAPSTRYPAGLTLAATWNSKRAFARGKQMGRDARARGYHVDLGPGIDPYRTGLGGRNFEYNTGEDPFLGSKLVIPLVLGFQQQGVWANVKHYAANEQEYRRENINILVDERSLREIYLPPFEAAVKQGHAASVMGALNAVNGDFAVRATTWIPKFSRRTGTLMAFFFRIIKASTMASKRPMPEWIWIFPLAHS
jgi:beta-glucosidase